MRLPEETPARLAIVVVAGLVGVGMLATPAIAGDNVAIFDLAAAETDVDPGETATVEVHFSSHGGYDGEGVVELAGTMSYDDDVLAVEEVAAGSFFAADDADADLTIDDGGPGTIAFENERVPDTEGSTGDEVVLRVTFVVDEDVSPTNAAIELDSHEAILETGVEQATFAHSSDVTLAVDGGVDDGADADDVDVPDGVTLGEEPTENDSDDPTDEAETSGNETGDAVPGFAVGGAILAICSLLAVSRLLSTR